MCALQQFKIKGFFSSGLANVVHIVNFSPVKNALNFFIKFAKAIHCCGNIKIEKSILEGLLIRRHTHYTKSTSLENNKILKYKIIL
jgi:hypothetical protein